MPDISMCENRECVMRHNCYRQMATHNPMYQSFGEFKPEKNDKDNFKCKYFWGMPEA